MNPLIKNVLAVIVGLVCGGITNMGIILLGSLVIAPPTGSEVRSYEGLAAALPLLEPKHFVTPFLAHALGTLVGAFIASLFAESRKMLCAMIVGGVTFATGIYAVFLFPAPAWFLALDLIVAYIPMAWLGGKLGRF